MLVEKFNQIKLLQKELNKIIYEKHSIEDHYSLFKNDEKIKDVQLSFSNEQNALYLNIFVSIDENEDIYPSFAILKQKNDFKIITEVQQKCTARSFFHYNESSVPTIEENIEKLQNEAKRKLVIAKYLESLQKEVSNSVEDIYNFYMQFFNSNVVKKDNLKEEIRQSYNELSNLYREKIKANFDINTSETFEEFILEKANCQSILELKEKHNNGDPIELPIVYSQSLHHILNTKHFSENSNILNEYSSSENFLKSELIMLRVKNNRLYFRSANTNGRYDAEYIFNARVLFQNKPCEIDTTVELKNGGTYPFFLKSEEEYSHIAFSKPNDKKDVLFDFLDNI